MLRILPEGFHNLAMLVGVFWCRGSFGSLQMQRELGALDGVVGTNTFLYPVERAASVNGIVVANLSSEIFHWRMRNKSRKWRGCIMMYDYAWASVSYFFHIIRGGFFRVC